MVQRFTSINIFKPIALGSGLWALGLHKEKKYVPNSADSISNAHSQQYHFKMNERMNE